MRKQQRKALQARSVPAPMASLFDDALNPAPPNPLRTVRASLDGGGTVGGPILDSRGGALEGMRLDDTPEANSDAPMETGGSDRLLGAVLAEAALVVRSVAIVVGPNYPKAGVPRGAERLLLLIYPPDRVDEVIGDMEELFHRVAARHGRGFAHAWYWWQLVCAAVSRLLALGERVSKIVSPFKGG